MMDDRQTEVQAMAEPIIEESIARMNNAGLTGPEIAQALVLTGAGLLAGALGPKGAGHDMRLVAEMVPDWIKRIGDTIEAKSD